MKSTFKSRVQKVMTITLIILTILSLVTFLFLQQDKFGKSPSGTRLERIKKSPHYKNGKFENLSPTPTLAEGYNYIDVIYDAYIRNNPRLHPTISIPSIKTDLKNLPLDSNLLVWFGHSSYLIQIEGKRILVDPVFSGQASPVPGTIKSFKGSDIYSAVDMPDIDYLFISHDHYDHLDYETIIQLKEKVNKVVCGLGVGSHFEFWGYDSDNIIEGDWYDKIELDKNFTVHIEPSRHFSGRSLSRNNTLWVSFLLQTTSAKIYLGGDSGYDAHYADIGKKHGPIDIAILDNGQYNPAWKYIHNLPEDVLQAAQDLHAKRILPVHSSKFALASHDWNEPLTKITELNQTSNISILTPKIGEVVRLNDTTQQFQKWWLELK